MPNYYDRNKFRQALAFIIIAFLILFILFSLSNFITAFLGAILFYVLFKPLMHRLAVRRKWNKSLAATLIIFISFLAVVVPVSLLGYVLFSKVGSVINDPSSLLQGITQFDKKIQALTGVDLISEANLQKIELEASNLIPGILNSTLQIVASLAIMYFTLFYLLVNFDKMETTLNHYLPFSDTNAKLFSNELDSMTYSNAIAVPLTATFQGILAALGFWIFGLHEPFFWGIMCGICSILPLIGSGLIWIPAGIFMIATGATWQGLGILLYGVLVISLLDNVFRFMFQKRFADVHPLITILGVIIGLNWFGLPGLVFGPLLISYFLIMLKIYRSEYLDN